jgi:hypothetical protein
MLREICLLTAALAFAHPAFPDAPSNAIPKKPVAAKFTPPTAGRVVTRNGQPGGKPNPAGKSAAIKPPSSLEIDKSSPNLDRRPPY